ncbi:MAG: hypothetical protein JKY71_03030 [Alphaproteobacteria bacterium]|nr:hypothetical protein [Alphaproteobacteria bacterium]
MPLEYKVPFHSESGPHESLQVFVALMALIFALWCLFILPSVQKPFLIFWVMCFVGGCTYIVGEEISWGQHIFDWGTPEYWTDYNDQNETNLHNTSSWLDQKPRLLLMIGVLTGGLIIPLLKEFKPVLLPKKFEIIYPPAILAPTALLVLIIKIIDKVDESTPDIMLLTRSGEVEELCLFYFVLLYLMILRFRFVEHKR